ncbi:MAG TPA: hypothetical protein VGQ99_18180, partial [Tepidisphaeraceae bacterium]|nr:hypothetical protein [Tepidisphaeraceae bacterium]
MSTASVSRAQNLFLRSFLTNPAGPAPADWPTPGILRRWLRKRGFIKALESLKSTLRFQSDFLLTSAATAALRTLDLLTASPDQARHTLNLLRLSHLRQRFESTSTTPLPNQPIPKPKDQPQPTPPPPAYVPPEKRLTDAEFAKL